jgi:hypothetical protein
MRRQSFFETKWGFIVIVAILLTFLFFSNPSSSDVNKWIHKKETASISDGVNYSYFRGKSYGLFSIHEVKIEGNGYVTTRTYIGILLELIRV